MHFFNRLVGYGLLFVLMAQMASCSPSIWQFAMASFEDNEQRPRSSIVLKIFDNAALRRFPDLDSCLFSWGDRPSWGSEPDEKILRLIAWSRIHSSIEAELCLSRIFRRIGNPESAEKWLREQGFLTSSFPPESRPVYIINGYWSISAFGPKFRGSSILARITPPLSHTMKISTSWDSNTGELLGIGVDFLVL